MNLLIQDELSTIVAEGTFGKNVNFVSFEMDKNLVGKDQFASTVLFGTVTTSDGLVRSVLIKLKLRDRVKREVFKNDLQFHNEIMMYERIIPFMLSCRSTNINDPDNHLSLARYFYGCNKCGEHAERDLIMLENVSPLGFRLSEERLFLDYKHLQKAIQTLAKFHALSYTAKHVDPAGFREVIADVRDTQFDPNGLWTFGKDKLLRTGTLGADRLLERDGPRYRNNGHLLRFNELIADGSGSLRRALKPREPLSVLCHGDFNRNNLLFRYDGGRLVDALPFDFATPRYGSPALDLSFFLYMNTTQSTRRHVYGDLLDAYCSALSAAVPSGCRGVPDRNDVHAEMAKSALFGFAHASFFLPYLTRLTTGRTDRAEDGDNDKGTEYVADMVQHLVDMGYTNV